MMAGLSSSIRKERIMSARLLVAVLALFGIVLFPEASMAIAGAGADTTRSAWRKGNKWLRLLIAAILVYPLVLTVAKLWMGPLGALITMFAFLAPVATTAFAYPLILPAIGYFDTGRSFLKGTVSFAISLLFIGLYVTLVPIENKSSDWSFIAPLIVIFYIFLLLPFASASMRTKTVRRVVVGVLLLLTGLFTSQVLEGAGGWFLKKLDGVSASTTTSYPPCADAHDISFSAGEKRSVALREDCWTGWIQTPSTAHNIRPTDRVFYQFDNGISLWDRPGEVHRNYPGARFRAHGVGQLLLIG